MSCEDTKKRLNAWMDGELPDHEAELVTRHVKGCEACRNEAFALGQISEAMEALPVVRAPSSLSRSTRRMLQNHFEQQRFSEWWQGLSMTLRGAVCGAALAGLVFGAVLGNGLSTNAPNVYNPYLSISNSQGYIP